MLQFENAMTVRTAYDEKIYEAERKVPQMHSNTMIFEAGLLKSALFRPGKGARAVHKDYVRVPAHGSAVIEFKGEELRQDDARLLLALLKLRSGKSIDGAITFVPRKFCREVLGWADSGDSVAKLKASLVRLQDARVKVSQGGGWQDYYSFVSDLSFSDDGWGVWLSARLMAVFGKTQTFVKFNERMSMLDGLGSWMYCFLKADACFAPFELEALRAWAGMEGYEQKEFNRQLKKVLEALVELAVIKEYAMEKGKLKARK